MIGALQAGTKENVIPDEAIIKPNVRTFDEDVRKRVLASIERIVEAEAAASGAPRKPELTLLDRYSLVVNDPETTERVGDAFRSHFPPARVQKAKLAGVCSSLQESWHSVTNIGNEPMQVYAIYAPAHHKPGKVHRTAADAAADTDDEPAESSVQPRATDPDEHA
jgi:metal-dependent amidase/aminoacylase/carboxypeptidase family protein